MSYTNITNIPLPLAVWLAGDHGYDLKFDPYTVSATDLLRPLRSLLLTRQIQEHEIEVEEVDIADMAAAKLGTAVHTAVEMAWLDHYGEAMDSLGYPKKVVDSVRINPTDPDPDDQNIYIERRSAKQVGKYTVSGKFDFVINGRVRDVKTTKTYNWINGSNNWKYMMQGSIYRWLNEDIITDDMMSVDYAFTDWSPLKALVDQDYPQTRILSQLLTLEPIADIEVFVTGMISRIDALTGKPQAEMPLCTEEELWQKPTKWAYYKDATKLTRATKLFDTSADAYARNTQDGGRGTVVERKSTPTFCLYCRASSICLQADSFRAAGLLK